MRLKQICYVISGLGLLLLAVFTFSTITPSKAAAVTACNAPTTSPVSTSSGTDTMSFNIPLSGTYKIWVRMEAGSSSNNSLLLNIDNGTCWTPTDSSTSWDWTEVSTGSTAMSQYLSAGSHQLVLSAGNSSGVGVDRIEFLSNTSNCTPTGTGYNCADNTAGLPTVSVTAPASAATVSGSSVPIAISAASDPNSPEVSLSSVGIYIDGGNTPITTLYPSNTSSATSPSGTIVPTNASQIIDSSFHIWTLSGGSVYRDGTETCSSNVAQIDYVNGVVYQGNIYGQWWEWNGGDNTDSFAPGSGVDPCSITNPWGNQLSAGPTNVPTLSSSSLSYNWDTTALSNGNHTITAVATDSQNQSKTSVPVTVSVNNTVACTANPSAPTGVSKSSSTPTSLSISWTASTPGAGCSIVSYAIYQGSTELGTSSSTSFTATGLSPNTNYNITVKATDGSGHVSVASSSIAMTTAVDPPPSEPATLSATAASDSLVNLSWSASTDDVGVTGYNIYRLSGTSGTPPTTTPYATVSGSTLSYADQVVTPGASYIYAVIAVSEGGESAERVASSVVNVPAAPVAPTPNAPSGLSATLITSTTVSLSWTASSSNDVAGYYIYRSTNGGSATMIGSTIGINNTAFTDGTSSALTPQTAYTYYVVAYVTSSNVSSHSSSVNVTTSAAPCTCSIAADINCEGVVGLSDLSILLSHWDTTSGALHSQGDVNLDGKVNLTDLSMMLSAWGETDTACI